MEVTKRGVLITTHTHTYTHKINVTKFNYFKETLWFQRLYQ